MQRLTSYLVGGTSPTKRNSKLNNNKLMWKLILEAFKIIHYKDSTAKCQDIYEQTLKLSYIDLHTRYSTIENF